MESGRARLEIENIGDVTMITFTDRKIMKKCDTQDIGQQLFDLVEGSHLSKIIMNFCNIDYLSSAFIQSKLITLNKKVEDQGGKLVFCNIQEDIYEVFLITRLNKLFNIVKNEEFALSMFQCVN